MYNKFADTYDLFVNWEERLQFEIPFIEEILMEHSKKTKISKIVDVACGTGMHAIALAKLGYEVFGTDIVPEMVLKARNNVKAAGVNVEISAVGFGHLSKFLTSKKPDALLCLGNSLPHVLSQTELSYTIKDFYETIKPGGLALIQNRNFDFILKSKNRWMDPQVHISEPLEWLFQRFYDFEESGLIRFNILTLKRRKGEEWQSELSSTFLFPFTKDLILREFKNAGFINIKLFGSLDGSKFNIDQSPNLIILAEKA